MADIEGFLTKEEMQEIGLEPDQVKVLKGCFDGFADEDGAIPADNVGGILSMMGMKVKPTALREIIEEIDEDGEQHKLYSTKYEWKAAGSGLLEFGEFCQLAAKFLVEEDDEALKKELKEAFRIYDKDQQGYITTGQSSMIVAKDQMTLHTLNVLILQQDKI